MLTPMMMIRALSLPLALFGCGACGAPALALGSIDTRTPAPSVVHDDTAGSDDDNAIPLSLSCVSAPLDRSDAAVPQVVRAQIQEVDEIHGRRIFSATVTTGPQFSSHNGIFDAPASEPRVDDVSADRDGGGVHFASTGRLAGLRVDVKRQGAAFVGTFADQDHRALALTCFSNSDLFGDYTSSTGARVAAHFDWTSESCVDRLGAPALNHLPIEVVRESGFGECADLRGLSLNGGDFDMPDVSMTLWGANLDNASLFQAALSGSFEGARLTNLDFGYATVSGTVDDATALPRGDGCTVTASPYGGSLLACSR